MDVALIGATGNAGSRILAELSRRGHSVTALARNPEKVEPLAGVSIHKFDIDDLEGLTAAVAGTDAVVSAVKFGDMDTQGVIGAIERSGVDRYVVVGGAGSLYVSPGVREVDGPGFPAHIRPEALKGAEFLDQLRASKLDWTFLSPSRFFEPGERTGQFRLGKDDLLFDENGRSGISFEDYAVALVDELETPKHVRQRFTVGY
jgi:putative NADH-flavin reductase